MAAQLSGLTPYVIRAWEKRYEAVNPRRSDGNQRHYSDDDVRRLKLLSRGVKSGHKISRLVPLDDAELESLVGLGVDTARGEVPREAEDIREQCLQAVRNLDAAALEDLLVRAAIDHGLMDAIDQVVVPLMEEIGEGWHEGRWRIFHEHLASAAVRSFLGGQMRSFEPPGSSPVAVVTTPSGQIHELGCTVAALAAASAGFRVVYLGPSIPAADIIHSVEASEASLLLISIVFPGSTARIRQEISSLRRYLPENCRLILGGASSVPFLEEGEEPAPRSMRAFRDMLLAVRSEVI